MRRFLAFGTSSALALTAVLSVVLAGGLIPTSQYSSGGSALTAGSISLWEAYAKGLVTIEQVEESPGVPIIYRVTNLGSVPINIDEKAMLLSPHPLETNPDPAGTTQDGALTEGTVGVGGYVDYWYASMGIDPKWWCTENFQLVNAGAFITLGGEVLPFAMENIINNATDLYVAQDAVWQYMADHPTLVVGKTPMWKLVPDVAGTIVETTITITNIGTYNSSLSDGSQVKAVNSIVRDTIPSGYSYDPNSFNIQPSSVVNNADGSKTLIWKVTLPGADVSWKDEFTPTPYPHMFLKYKLILPVLAPNRYFLPRITVDTNVDGIVDAHSEAPILDTYHVNRPAVPDAGGPYFAAENTAVRLDGSGSSDPDSGPSNLTYRWDFQNDGVWDTAWSSSPLASYTWGDDYRGVVALQVSDGNASAKGTANVTILNVLPSGSVSITSAQHEGSPITFSAHVTDPGSDDIFLTWKWGFGAPDEKSTYYNNGVSPDPYPSTDIHPRDVTDVKTHTYGDNGAFTVTVFVQDDDSGNQGTTLQITATPDNLPPTVQVSGGMSIDEGQSVSLTAVGKDPGSDDLTFKWDWGEGSTTTKTYYNDGVGPDPSQSPGGTFPFTATDTATHAYGDNGAYMITLKVTDDDGGFTTWSGQLTVINLPPEIQPFGPFTVDEGSPLSVNATATDPGSDDLTFTWSFELGPTLQAIYYNDGVGPDPPQSPSGIYPFTAADTASWTYGDNADYLVTLTVTDDDGGVTVYTTNITVNNVMPVVTPFGPFVVSEGDPLAVTASSFDPGSDDLYFYWSFDFGPNIEHVYYNDGIGPDPPKSPNGTFPFSVDDTVSHTYGDNGVFGIALSVRDDDMTGGGPIYRTTVTVLNVAPEIRDVQAYAIANLTLRVAGEKWHDVRMDLVWDGNVTGSAHVVRYPGSPDRQEGTIRDGHLMLTGNFSIVLYYTPNDDPVNGQVNGANPVWVIITFPDGSEVRLHHTFNVQHPSTYVWTVTDLRPFLVGKTITFSATAHDVGSDDLTFTWSFGDGSPDSSAVYYNNGIGPDPYPSPEVNPITVTDTAAHVYSAAGVFVATLIVMDDDGGITGATMTIALG